MIRFLSVFFFLASAFHAQGQPTAQDGLWSRVQKQEESPGILLARTRLVIISLIQEGRMSAVDSLLQEARGHFQPPIKPLFLFPVENVLLQFLLGNASAWTEPGALHRTLSDAGIGYTAPQLPPHGDALYETLVSQVRERFARVEEGIYGLSISREQKEYLRLAILSLIQDSSHPVWGWPAIVAEGERFRLAYAGSAYAQTVYRHFPHEPRPSFYGFGMDMGFGRRVHEQPLYDWIGNGPLFSTQISGYFGYVTLSGLFHFVWGMEVHAPFTHKGEWSQGWNLQGFDAGFASGYRLFPLHRISLEPHLGWSWFEIKHQDMKKTKRRVRMPVGCKAKGLFWRDAILIGICVPLPGNMGENTIPQRDIFA